MRDDASTSSNQRAASSATLRVNDHETAEPVSFERTPSTLVIRLRGPVLGQHEAPEVTRLAGPAVEVAPGDLRRVVIDLSEVSGISSLGLGTCLDLRRRADARGAETILLGMSPSLRQVFYTMRLDRMFSIEPSVESLFRRLAAGA